MEPRKGILTGSLQAKSKLPEALGQQWQPDQWHPVCNQRTSSNFQPRNGAILCQPVNHVVRPDMEVLDLAELRSELRSSLPPALPSSPPLHSRMPPLHLFQPPKLISLLSSCLPSCGASLFPSASWLLS